jgi:hypothetical protein
MCIEYCGKKNKICVMCDYIVPRRCLENLPYFQNRTNRVLDSMCDGENVLIASIEIKELFREDYKGIFYYSGFPTYNVCDKCNRKYFHKIVPSFPFNENCNDVHYIIGGRNISNYNGLIPYKIIIHHYKLEELKEIAKTTLDIFSHKTLAQYCICQPNCVKFFYR